MSLSIRRPISTNRPKHLGNAWLRRNLRSELIIYSDAPVTDDVLSDEHLASASASVTVTCEER